MQNNYPSSHLKSKLKFVQGRRRPGTDAPRQRGVPPAEDMPPGRYKVACESARLVQKWGKTVAEFSFRVVEGTHFGTCLSGWFPLHMVADLLHPGRYTEICAMALGREVTVEDDLSPEAIFEGKIFWAEVAFRSNTPKNRNPENPNVRKDQKDFLRVRSLSELATL